MAQLNKKSLSERDICTKFIAPAIVHAGWENKASFLEEVNLTDGKIYFKGKFVARGERRRADFVLYHKLNIPVAVIEAKENHHSIGDGMQQALKYAEMLDVPVAFSSNGDGFLMHDKTASNGKIETQLALEDFPSPEQLWAIYKKYKGIETEKAELLAAQAYHTDGTGRQPRYYQQIAVNKAVEAVAKGQNRLLLVMATGTGKTYTAFQIIYRLWKAGAKKRILFLADRNALIDQTRRGDFKFFRDKMTVVRHREVDKSYEVYLALYQGLTGNEEKDNIFRQFRPDFFDLIVIDECHRGSAKENSAWREILNHFSAATHLGLTATPKETEETSNMEYFGQPIYVYSLLQGIEDGFLAPYRTVRIGLNVDLDGWRPDDGQTDERGRAVDDRVYNRLDFEKNLVIRERVEAVADKITEFLKGTDRFSKTIVFCQDQEHADRMRSALLNANADLAAFNPKYVMRITSDDGEGKRELDNFTSPTEKYPVIVTTSELLTTGIDAKTCKVIVLDSEIRSMTKFKQIIGRGTRIDEDEGKLFFTIIDFRRATDLFSDEKFDGPPMQIKVAGETDDLTQIEAEEEALPETFIDPVSEQLVQVLPPNVRTPADFILGDSGLGLGEGGGQPHEKIYVRGVDVTALSVRELYYDKHGKPVTDSLKSFAKREIGSSFASLDQFLTRWRDADRKEAILKELEQLAVPVDALQKAVNRDVDIFDILCHVAFDAPPLTRRERAENVRKRHVFAKYGTEARQVLETLLEKYAVEGVVAIEDTAVLRIQPFDRFGSPVQIVQLFGGINGYDEAVLELKRELYKAA